MSLMKELRPTLPILIGAAIMLSLSGGIRQSFGLIMPPLTRDIAVSVSDFALAMSVQNLAWGFLQPVAGALAVRVGFRPVMLGGSVLYIAGMLTFALAEGMLGVMLGAGVMIGLALACTASAIALAVGSRAVPSHWRSLVLGAITASGSLGALCRRRSARCWPSTSAGGPASWAFSCWRSACCRRRGSPAASIACRYPAVQPNRARTRPRPRCCAPPKTRPSWS